MLLSHAVRAPGRIRRARTSDGFRFAAAVAEFGMLLRRSEHRGRSSLDDVLSLARGALGDDAHGHRRAFIGLVDDGARAGKPSPARVCVRADQTSVTARRPASA